MLLSRFKERQFHCCLFCLGFVFDLFSRDNKTMWETSALPLSLPQNHALFFYASSCNCSSLAKLLQNLNLHFEFVFQLTKDTQSRETDWGSSVSHLYRQDERLTGCTTDNTTMKLNERKWWRHRRRVDRHKDSFDHHGGKKERRLPDCNDNNSWNEEGERKIASSLLLRMILDVWQKEWSNSDNPSLHHLSSSWLDSCLILALILVPSELPDSSHALFDTLSQTKEIKRKSRRNGQTATNGQRRGGEQDMQEHTWGVRTPFTHSRKKTS